MTEEKRIINWNAGMQNDFHYLATDSENGACLLYNFMSVDDEDYPSLGDYFNPLSDENKTQFAQDLIDLYTGKAKFSDKKYYVHLIEGDEYSYLNINSEGGAELGTKFGFGHWKTKFTIDEVAAMNPQLVLFMEEVEDY
ncbi:hypothetical protein M5C72_04950 [Companilactobacillus allii]|uniref:Uncharacterized protein n=1 Tax=Companilactobacillus allii TaxID=1847728 RepID=A0A1P8Q3P3_9LACO|nr:hypothetical protein [Companilactobacillus allii]APX72471.1 hypothetical protein BTM29_07875 [Companilactobacillus allii]USQ69570.1 hypothetical protein M5C72_04950 [Companilactobacillus allii]